MPPLGRTPRLDRRILVVGNDEDVEVRAASPHHSVPDGVATAARLRIYAVEVRRSGRYANGVFRPSILAALSSLACTAVPAAAQSNGSVRSTREAYGVRLDNAAQPNNLNTRRVNDRLNTRINNRLNLRIERYRLGQTEDPASAFRVRQDDGSRTAADVKPKQQQQQND